MSSVTWFSAPCTEPVLLIPVDKENVRDHIPRGFPGSDDDFMERVLTTPGPDGPLATVVITLNRCESNEMMLSHGGNEVHVPLADDTAEVLVMVMYDTESSGPFEFYTLASYVNEPLLSAAFLWLGLPVRYTPQMSFTLDVSPPDLDPGAVVPFSVVIPHRFRIDGTVVRPEEHGEGGDAKQIYHGYRGRIVVDHLAPEGGMATTQATVTVTEPWGAWLADLLGDSVLEGVEGLYLEKLDGHAHVAALEE